MNEYVLAVFFDPMPWYANLAIYFGSEIISKELTFHKKNEFLDDVCNFFGMILIYSDYVLKKLSINLLER